MGLTYTFCKFTALVLVAVFFAPGLPPHFDFVVNSLPDRPELKGPLALNNKLDKAQPVTLDGRIAGPESIARRGPDEIFTGLIDGRLVRIKDGRVTNIGAFGENCASSTIPGSCGRIAGLRFDKQGKLFAADAVNGIYKIDVDTGKSTKLVNLDEAIDGIRPRFPDDLDVDKEGNIYWSDASTISDIHDLAIEGLAGPTGRLVMSNPKTGKSRVLISKLHFSNGVQLSPNEDYVLVTETMGARVWRYYLKGKQQGQKDIFIDNLPGLPDNIRPNGRGGYFIVLAAPRHAGEFSLIDVAGKWPLTRRFAVRANYFLVKGLQQFDEFFPSVFLKEWIIWVRGFGPVADLEQVPFKTIIVETDEAGKIIGTLQNDKGPIARLSEISIGEEWTYFGSPTLKQLYRIKTSELRS